MLSRFLRAPARYIERSLTRQMMASQSAMKKRHFADDANKGKPTQTETLEREDRQHISDTTLPISQPESALDSTAKGPTTKIVEFHSPETHGRPLTETPDPVHVPAEDLHFEDTHELVQDMIIAEETFMDSLVNEKI